MTTIVEVYQCKCNAGFVYKNKQSFKNHFKSERHLCWQYKMDNQNYLEQIIRLENRISSLKIERNMWREMAIRLEKHNNKLN